MGLDLRLGLRSAYRIAGRPAEPWHGQPPDWLEFMVGVLFLFLPSSLAFLYCGAIYILDGREGGNGRATLTPEVVFIEKKKKTHTHTQCIHTLTLAGLVRKWWGRGTGAPRGLAIALVNEVAIAGHRATYLPFIG